MKNFSFCSNLSESIFLLPQKMQKAFAITLLSGCLFCSGALEAQQNNPDKEYSFVEQDPLPPGNDLSEYIRKNIRYPLKAIEEGVGGKVFVSFLVTESGELTDVKLLKGAGYGMDEEALRIFREMPAWTPGKNAGRNVKVRMNLPIVFHWEEEPFTKEDSLKMMKRFGKEYQKECESSADYGLKKENESAYQFEGRTRRYREFQNVLFRKYRDLYRKENKAEMAKRRLLAYEIRRSLRSEKTGFDKIGSFHKKSQTGRVKICGKKYDLKMSETDFTSMKELQEKTDIRADFQLDAKGKNTECFNIRIKHPKTGKVYLLEERTGTYR